MSSSTQSSRSSRLPAVLFVAAGVTFFVSLICPVTVVLTGSNPIPGMAALYYTTIIPLNGLWRCVTQGEWRRLPEVTPFLLGFMANFTLLTNGFAAEKLRRRHTPQLLLWSLCGLASGLIIPLILGNLSWETYGEFYFGYWLWIASLALVAAGWGSVVWNQRKMRDAAIAGEATSSTAERQHELDERP